MERIEHDTLVLRLNQKKELFIPYMPQAHGKEKCQHYFDGVGMRKGKLMKRKTNIICVVLIAILAMGPLFGSSRVYAKWRPRFVTGRYNQISARKMLKKINNLRENNAWYYDEDGSRVWCDDLEPLEYDYDLEKIAM